MILLEDIITLGKFHATVTINGNLHPVLIRVIPGNLTTVKDNVQSQRGLLTYERTAIAIHYWNDLAKTNGLIPLVTSKSDAITSKK